MIDFAKISNNTLNTQPYPWAEINSLFFITDAADLVKSYPMDHYKTVEGYDGEKGYFYEARSLISMGGSSLSFANELSPSWYDLGQDLLSSQYREAMSMLTGYDLTHTPFEANLYHYNSGAYLGPHRDLPEKLVVHVLYFNEYWGVENGGCLHILNSADSRDIAVQVLPVVGNSAVFVRSDHSWHEVTQVKNMASESRRSLVVTFYKTGSISTMWKPREKASLHTYYASRI